jgi:hypothetical protein
LFLLDDRSAVSCISLRATCSDDDVIMLLLRLLLIDIVLGLIDNIRLLIAKPVVRSGIVAIDMRHENTIMMGES